MFAVVKNYSPVKTKDRLFVVVPVGPENSGGEIALVRRIREVLGFQAEAAELLIDCADFSGHMGDIVPGE